jgi:hypothetical protein
MDNTQQNQTENVKEMPPLACGYVVGLQEDGKFFFEVLGNNNGLLQLLGLHSYAGHRIDCVKDVNQGTGFPVLAQQNLQIAEVLKQISQDLKKLLPSDSKLATP